MPTHRTKVRRHLRNARVAAQTNEERREEMRAAEARWTPRHDRSEQAGADPAGLNGREPQDSSPDSRDLEAKGADCRRMGLGRRLCERNFAAARMHGRALCRIASDVWPAAQDPLLVSPPAGEAPLEALELTDCA